MVHPESIRCVPAGAGSCRRGFAGVPEQLYVIGDCSLLASQPLGLLCSTRLPGSIILKTYDLFQRLKLRHVTVVGGFHSPMERQCLQILLSGRGRAVIVPARGLGRIRIPREWQKLLSEGRLAVVSPFSGTIRRVNRSLAERRNRCVAFLSHRLFVPHAGPGSMTERIALEAARCGVPVLVFDDPENTDLLRHGASLIESQVANCYLPQQDDG